mmetsp:Transcript_39752/g.105280  ORF Transcript_39752/g.105280 Transcript_39752/m.105280 type:complete len:112 (-) Transcript_39752:460-795(-)
MLVLVAEVGGGWGLVGKSVFLNPKKAVTMLERAVWNFPGVELVAADHVSVAHHLDAAEAVVVVVEVEEFQRCSLLSWSKATEGSPTTTLLFQMPLSSETFARRWSPLSAGA